MMADTTDATAKPSRRTQAERSEAMRERLVDATLKCLVSEGYSGTTVSRIVAVAQVSRGAPVHHFPTKAALIEAAAEKLVRHFYIELGRIMLSLEASDDRLQKLIMVAWRNLMATPETTALLELLVASRHEPELAAVMRTLWAACYRTTQTAATHYLEPVGADDNVSDFMILTQWLLRGMAEDYQLTGHEPASRAFFDRYLALWSSLLQAHLRARPGVTTPPPRPAHWDSSLVSIRRAAGEDSGGD
ncbi:MAG: transcriptional regulator [Moraxellaceae bacterium]|jgi:AcrR family transcriptional regulator|nr:transcriptional regulator [Moraxellaceae bacterium]